MRTESFADLDRLVVGTAWGVAVAMEGRKRSNAQRWGRIRQRQMARASAEPTSAASLERQIAALAVAHPEYVVVGAA